ncbi:unnamed protein product [Blepharisma stoltei]|uniref:Myb-like DNA-binding domain containing protein n=1 Tax=Blepharisma stoltei TaxID=1481888 RepID=A0AAU9J906_9CILI|nr:unnamed protein product [Blepharisma stoltei]
MDIGNQFESKLIQIADFERIEGNTFYVPCIWNSGSSTFLPLIKPDQPKTISCHKLGKWTKTEDLILSKIIEVRGPNSWSKIAKELNSLLYQKKQIRNGKQCRERWLNRLNPIINKNEWTEEEDLYIINQQVLIGNKWCEIARGLKGRTENSVKNRFKSLMAKRSNESPIRKVPKIEEEAEIQRFDAQPPTVTILEKKGYFLECNVNNGDIMHESTCSDFENNLPSKNGHVKRNRRRSPSPSMFLNV